MFSKNLTKYFPFAFLFIAVTFIVTNNYAQEKDNDWYKSININGFVSASYSYNFNKPTSNLNKYRVFDYDNNSFKLDVAELLIQKPVINAGSAGFKIDFIAGSSIPKIIASTGLFRDKNGNANDFDIPQAYISYIAPIGNGLRFDFGKFYTHVGYELIEGFEGFNNNSSHSFLFGFSEPTTHTGLHIIYPFSDKFSTMIMVVNGWDNAIDNNSSKSVGAQIAFTPNEDYQLLANFIGGPEKDNNNSDYRYVYNLSLNDKLSSSLTCGLALDYGSEMGMLANNGNASWFGSAVYINIKMTEKFNLALRGEVFNDKNGARTGLKQTLSEITITPKYQFSSNFALRGDIRLDNSNQFIFDKEGAIKKNQLTASINALYWF